jgi:RNA polymerase sigma-54 factor
MSMEIKQHLKLSQQLVMTPQLQQAIKLLQLSRAELVDMVREELLENPILEDTVESARSSSGKRPPSHGARPAPRPRWRRIGETESPVAQPSGERLETTPEVKATPARARRSPSSTGRATSRTSRPRRRCRRTAQQRGPPSLEATLTRGTSLFDHLEWQLKLCRLSQQEEAVALLIIGNLTPDGYLDMPLDEIARRPAWRRVRRGGAARRCRSSIRPAWPRAICRSACSFSAGTSAPMTTW